MTRRVLVVGHADGDGHLIAEQVRRNLSLLPKSQVSVVVDPRRTQGHQAWLHLDRIPELEAADVVFFVDLMFSPFAFDEESDALIEYASSRPQVRFYVIDHHPLPLARLLSVPNIRTAYRPDVYECAVGPRSGMMVLAAICERQKEGVADVRKPHHDVLARGVRRAAAPGGSLAGGPLMELLKADRWDVIYALGEDDDVYHRLVRGRRVSNSPKSKVFAAAELAAENAHASFINKEMPLSTARIGRIDSMPYDVGIERIVHESPDSSQLKNEPVASKDLEALVTLLEVAALSLSDSPNSTFSRDELIQEARLMAGPDFEIDDRDAKIVLEKATFVRGSVGELRLR
jgi:hypothetical protein